MRKLIAKYRLKPDVDTEDCVFITLSDGQPWAFPRPLLEIVPRFEGGKATLAGQVLSLGDLDPLLEMIAEDNPPVERIIKIMQLGALMLTRLYDVADEELPRLFTYRAGDPASDAMILAILDVATGGLHAVAGGRAIHDPKASGAGCA